MFCSALPVMLCVFMWYDMLLYVLLLYVMIYVLIWCVRLCVDLACFVMFTVLAWCALLCLCYVMCYGICVYVMLSD